MRLATTEAAGKIPAAFFAAKEHQVQWPWPSQNNAMGLTGEPVPPTTRRGLMVSMNS